MSDSLKNKTLHGAFWTVIERLGSQVVGFVVTVVLARLLQPSDYGAIGMLAVFLSISQMFIDCGFGSALIRKKDRTDIDFSTVFWYNLAVAIVCYGILFAVAPLISSFYNMPVLSAVLRVVGVNLVIQALFTIQITRLTAAVQFKTQAKVTVLSCVLGGCIGICFAFLGYGVWALVFQSLASSLVSGLAYWIVSDWRPAMRFSYDAFRQLFGFGSKIMAASCMHTIYTNISPLIVGRKYSATDLGLYSRADSLAALPGSIFQGTLGRVIFPVLASIQDDESRLITAYSKYLKVITSIVVPAMLTLAACAEPVVVMLVGERWIPCVPYLRLLAIGWACDPIIVVNLNILYVKGRSDIVLRLEIIKKAIAILIVVVAVQFGVLWLCVGRVVYAYVALALNLHYCGPFIGMGFGRQMRQVAPIYVVSILSSLLAYSLVCVGSSHQVIESAFFHSVLTLGLAGGGAVAIYGGMAYFLKFDLIIEGLKILRRGRTGL